MKFIGKIIEIVPEKPNGLDLIYMHGYGGHIWQAKRHLKVLRKAGYRIIAMDFSYRLGTYNPQHLIDLMDEVDELIQAKGLIKSGTVIIGISLGGLVGVNLIRRHKELNKLMAITGGDITHLPAGFLLKTKWKLTRQELAKRWADVNMYTKPGTLRDKHIIMMLPIRDKVIDPNEVMDEVKLQQQYNDIKLVITKGGHFRTIITQTILFPRKNLTLFEEIIKY